MGSFNCCKTHRYYHINVPSLMKESVALHGAAMKVREQRGSDDPEFKNLVERREAVDKSYLTYVYDNDLPEKCDTYRKGR